MHYTTATSNKIGNPDFFIIMTSNWSWLEIRRAQMPGEVPQDRLHLAFRVFMIKLETMMSCVTDQKPFDDVPAHLGVVQI